MIFRKHYTVCKQCSVHFEPAEAHERHKELCPEHRKPVVDIENRIERVLDWAKVNWEKLEPQALEEEQKRNQTLCDLYNQAYRQGEAFAKGIGAI